MSCSCDENKACSVPAPAPAAEKEASPAPASTSECVCCDKDKGDDDYPWWTAPFDARFPNQNQAKHCYVSYLEYQRCIKTKGECFGPCEYLKKVYKSICPNDWTKKWDEQLEAGTFAGKI